MHKKYIVRLTEAERKTLIEVIKKLKGTSEKVRRAQILLIAEVDGPLCDEVFPPCRIPAQGL